jgi:hypothetical protein
MKLCQALCGKLSGTAISFPKDKAVTDDPGHTPEPEERGDSWGGVLWVVILAIILGFGAYQMQRSNNTQVVPNKMMGSDPETIIKAQDRNTTVGAAPSGANPYAPSGGNDNTGN